MLQHDPARFNGIEYGIQMQVYEPPESTGFLYLTRAAYGISHLALSSDSHVIVYPMVERLWPREGYERFWPYAWVRYRLNAGVDPSPCLADEGQVSFRDWLVLLASRRDCVSVVRNALRSSGIPVPTFAVTAGMVVRWLLANEHCTYDGYGHGRIRPQ